MIGLPKYNLADSQKGCNYIYSRSRNLICLDIQLLKPKSCHVVNFLLTDDSRGRGYDNLRCY